MSDQKEKKSAAEEKDQTSGSIPPCCDFEKMQQMMMDRIGSGDCMPDCRTMMQKMSCCGPAANSEK